MLTFDLLTLGSGTQKRAGKTGEKNQSVSGRNRGQKQPGGTEMEQPELCSLSVSKPDQERTNPSPNPNPGKIKRDSVR